MEEHNNIESLSSLSY